MLVMDIGGTFIKSALTDSDGKLIPGTVVQTPSDANGSCERFLNTLSGILASALDRQAVERVCISIAGPFDFARGVSLMQHKFPALYQQSLRPPFERAGIPVDFVHDSTSFLLGELHDGVLSGKKNAACVMLGTGLGFAFARDGRAAVSPERAPAFVLWNMPWKDGTAEDYVSTRALQRLYGEMLPIKAIADKARAGEAKAADAFLETGRELSAILRKILPELDCGSFALGGQIAKSADLFHLDLPLPWAVSRHLDDAALRGASYFALHGPEACETLVKID